MTLDIDTISQWAPSPKKYGFHMCYRKHKEYHKGIREPLQAIFNGVSMGISSQDYLTTSFSTLTRVQTTVAFTSHLETIF